MKRDEPSLRGRPAGMTAILWQMNQNTQSKDAWLSTQAVPQFCRCGRRVQGNAQGASVYVG